jgi:hypothetical protein
LSKGIVAQIGADLLKCSTFAAAFGEAADARGGQARELGGLEPGAATTAGG